MNTHTIHLLENEVYKQAKIIESLRGKLHDSRSEARKQKFNLSKHTDQYREDMNKAQARIESLGDRIGLRDDLVDGLTNDLKNLQGKIDQQDDLLAFQRNESGEAN